MSYYYDHIYKSKHFICDNNFLNLYPKDSIHPMDVFYFETKNVNRRYFRSGTMSASKVFQCLLAYSELSGHFKRQE